MNRKFVLNADDFGMNTALNRAVLEGYNAGLLKSASLTANGEAFKEAVETIIPQCPELGVGIHLNFIEGKALFEGKSSINNSEGQFCLSFGEFLIKAYNPFEKDFLKDIEREARLQIEKILARTPVSHIDSHVHVHSIPPIFNVICRLAQEYGIKQVRTQFEKPYIIPDLHKNLNTTFPVNLIKRALLNYFTKINNPAIKKYELNTNNYLLGVTYTSMMDALAISYGLMKLNKYNICVEALIHPCRYEDGTVDNHFNEFLITQNQPLKERIEDLGFEITNYVEKKY